MKNLYFLIICLVVLPAFSHGQKFIGESNTNTNNGYMFKQAVWMVQYDILKDLLLKRPDNIRFAENSTIDSAYLQKVINDFNKLKQDYFNFDNGIPVINVKVSDKSINISCTRYYLERIGKDQIKTYFGLKLVFEGTNPEFEMKSPRIKEIEILYPENITLESSQIIEELKINEDKNKGNVPPPPPPGK
ncbi:MAG: hypothetical protein MI922_18925 [Bacteroidales bacterium]|nr:hypothetical protein [Bacteroidales bacterium]